MARRKSAYEKQKSDDKLQHRSNPSDERRSAVRAADAQCNAQLEGGSMIEEEV